MEKSFVTMEQKVCPICGKTFDSGALLLDRRMRNQFDMKTTTGYDISPDCQQKIDDGYMALVVADQSKSKVTNGTVKLEDVYRTGEILWIKRDVFNQIFNADEKRPFVFCDEDLPKKLRGMMKPPKKKRVQKLRKDEIVTKKGIKRVKKK